MALGKCGIGEGCPPLTKADAQVRVSAGWNTLVTHPDVTLTVNDFKSVELGFQNVLSGNVALTAGGSQSIPDVIDPIEIAPLPIFWAVSATAEASGSALPGTLRASAKATAAQSPTSQSYSYISPQTQLANSVTKYDPAMIGGSAEVVVGWDDVFTVTSPTLPVDTSVNLRYTIVMESSVQNPHGTSGAREYLLLVPEFGGSVVVAQVANFSGAAVNTKIGTIGVRVGRPVELQGSLDVSAHAAAQADPFGPGSVASMDAYTLALNTGHFYFELEPGIDATIVAQSGTSYAPPPPAPALSIQTAGDSIVLSWPATASGYQLEVITALGAGQQWVAVTNLPATVGLQNVVTNALTGTKQFYRLRQ